MSDSCCSEKCRTGLATVLGLTGSFLIIGALTWVLVRQTDAQPDAERAALRARTRAELAAAAQAESEKFAIIDPNKNWTQLSVKRAMEVFVDEWKDGSAAGREKLLKRFENTQKQVSFE